jgi:branched-chain amino acid transport system substrate-binding protein
VGKYGNEVIGCDQVDQANRLRHIRGASRFNSNQYPVHNLPRVVQKGASGKIANRLVSAVLVDHADPFVGACSLK